jgi:hypothetical protein
MSCKIEIAKRKHKVPSDQIENAVWSLLEDKKLQKNSIVYIPSVAFPKLNEFQDLHSITFNDIPVSLRFLI